ncbi:alpha/beta fold hydrolase [Allohahella marinimesophila]|uniref:Alpha/beta fold hydrolase n=1 Tax=Allohahella marinimesophila TaxID=1054972 RepID=A0ABP7P7R3_9GAMM
MSIPLNARRMGSAAAPDLLMAHGLFGSLENLLAPARKLSEDFHIHLLDLRNHGQSPHCNDMGYPAMADDVLQYLDEQALDRVFVLGHSMGGKVMMQLALDHPERVKALIVADISPVTYPPHHNAILDGLKAIRLSDISSRRDADAALSAFEPNLAVRQFLLKNLRLSEDADGQPPRYEWRLNLDAIIAGYDRLAEAPVYAAPYTGPTLFIKGGESAYIQKKHQATINTMFPAAQVRIMPGASHWLHAEKPDLFSGIVKRFLDEL